MGPKQDGWIDVEKTVNAFIGTSVAELRKRVVDKFQCAVNGNRSVFGAKIGAFQERCAAG